MLNTAVRETELDKYNRNSFRLPSNSAYLSFNTFWINLDVKFFEYFG